MIEVACPECGQRGSPEAFSASVCDECFCPACKCSFILEWDNTNEDDMGVEEIDDIGDLDNLDIE